MRDSPMRDSSSDTVIRIRGLLTQFGRQVVHQDLDLDIQRGEVIAIVGGSGSGKTTLVREILTLTPPAGGSIQVFDQEVADGSAAAQRLLAQRSGVLFQQGALFSSLTIQENVAIPLREHTRLGQELIEEIARLKIALAGLPPATASKYPAQLSGGMIKRAALARALALDPELLFLDEPSAGLDPVSANALDELILQLRESLKLTVVMVTHDLDSLWRVTDRVAFLAEKRVLACEHLNTLSRRKHPEIEAYFGGPRGRAAAQTEETTWKPGSAIPS